MRERLPLKELAEEVIDTAVLQASSRVVLFNHVPPGLLIDADREHLNRVLTNLLRNAIQALEAQDGRRQDGRVIISAWREGAVVVVEVKDNGPGIPERVRPEAVRGLPECGEARRRGPGARHRGGADPRPWRRNQAARHRPEGTVFHVVVPDAVVELRPGRRGRAQPGAETACVSALDGGAPFNVYSVRNQTPGGGLTHDPRTQELKTTCQCHPGGR